MSKEYSQDSIQVLGDIEHIKQRRGMYIGTGETPYQLLSEIIDNAIDEVQAGYSDELIVYVDTVNNEYIVRDYGRGIPHGKKLLENGEEKEVLEVLLTKSHSGGKFDNNAYAFSSGLNGLGLTITNALSNIIEITSYRDGKFVRATAHASNEVDLEYGKSKERRGTEVKFIPNAEMFHSDIIPLEQILTRCKTTTALGFRARLFVDGVEQKTDYSIYDLMKEEKVSNYAQVTPIHVISENGEQMKVAIKYTNETNDKYFGYTNLLINSMGGTHINELSKSIIAVWKELLDKNKNLRPETELHPNDFLVGLRAVCAVFISKPEFSSQTKEKLVVNKKYFDDLMDLFRKQFMKFLKSNMDLANQLIKRFEEYRKSQNALLSRKEISSLIKVNTDSEDNIRRRSVVSKLVECCSKKREGTELFICLAGNTKVKLLNGNDVEIQDLVGQENVWAYSVDEEGKFIPTKILKAFKTQEVNKLLRIHFSDGSYVDCTPEHRFMDRDSLTWVEAKDMFIGQSMLTVKTKVEDGYINVWVPMKYEKYNSKTKKKQGHWEVLHKRIAKCLGLVDNYDGETIYQVHHIDHCRTNNDPSNFEIMTLQEHFRHHALHNIESGVTKAGFDSMSEESRLRMQNGVYMRTPEGIERQREAARQSWKDNPNNPNRTWSKYNFTDKFWEDVERNKPLHSKLMKDRWASMTEEEKQLANEINRIGTMKAKRIQCIKLCQQLIESGYEVNSENWKQQVWKNGLPSFNKAVEYFGSKERLIEETRNYNLKVVSIEELNYEEKVPVYCLTVDNPVHSFVLSNGIVTHNCEGDSALGPYRFVRNKETQAILPLRGKILNVTGKSLKEVVQNKEICDIANSIGCGLGANCDASKSRYEKIIISADADADGAQINCLVLSVFVNLFPDLVRAGRVYVSLPPLYCWGTTEKDFGWCNDIHEVPEGVKNLHRFKGLGEMNDSQLYHFLVNPETRNVMKIDYPSDIDKFNSILGTSEGKSDLMRELGVVIS